MKGLLMLMMLAIGVQMASASVNYQICHVGSGCCEVQIGSCCNPDQFRSVCLNEDKNGLSYWMESTGASSGFQISNYFVPQYNPTNATTPFSFFSWYSAQCNVGGNLCTDTLTLTPL